jgi:hypothetical protein
MRFAVSVAVPFSLILGLAVNAEAQKTFAPCGFSVASTSGTPRVTGSPALTALLTLVPQPDSPVEIVSIDLSKMDVSIAGSSYQARGSEYRVVMRNRSDQPIREVRGLVGFRIGDGPDDSGSGWVWTGTMPPGQTADAVVRFGGGAGAAATSGDVTLSVLVQRVDFDGCVYMPSRSYARR